MIFFSFSFALAPFHVPLLADGLNSERVYDKRVKRSSTLAFHGWRKKSSTTRLSIKMSFAGEMKEKIFSRFRLELGFFT
jgi:hypothetical protein